MRIEIIPCLKDNYSYLIIDESNNTACVIDPSEAEPIINFIERENIALKYILNSLGYSSPLANQSVSLRKPPRKSKKTSAPLWTKSPKRLPTIQRTQSKHPSKLKPKA